jgi:hypothetical protein
LAKGHSHLQDARAHPDRREISLTAEQAQLHSSNPLQERTMNGRNDWVRQVAALSIAAALLVATRSPCNAQGAAAGTLEPLAAAATVPHSTAVPPVVAPAALQPGRMPVFRLRGPQVDRARGREIFGRALGGTPQEQDLPDVISFRSGNRVLEVQKRSGHIFMADLDSLWNPRVRGNVPDAEQARQVADRFVRENRLLPSQEGRARAVFSHYSETAGGEDTPGAANRVVLDRQVNYRMEVVVRDPGGQERAIPVYGGGGKLKVAVGGGGRVLGFSGGWRDIEGVQAEEPVLPQEEAEARFRRGFGSTQVQNVRARLAYYAAPGFQEQSVLAPVWVVSGEVRIGGNSVPTREVVIPATSHGPNIDPGPQQPPRPAPQALLPRPPRLGIGISLQEEFGGVSGAAAQSYRCGTSWIGTSQGLSGSSGNKQGFVDQCRAAGWGIGFDWGDTNAWQSDWVANDDVYVDNVDLVFYTGHAGPDGWAVNLPSATDVLSSTVNVTGTDLWGNGRLRWMIVAACGPHQSTHFTTGTSNAFDRWRNVFDGMNIFLGYGAVTNDNTTEGRRFMELTRAGWSVIDAWFRTAWEVQPSTNGYAAPWGPTVYVTAMYAHNGSHCQRNERLYGMGATCPSVVGATQQRWFMWSGT